MDRPRTRRPTPLRPAMVVTMIAALAGCASSTVPVAAEPPEEALGVTVIAEGEASAKPDIARAEIGVEVRAAAVARATEEANKKMERLVAALRSAGIAEKDMQTGQYSVVFERRHDPPPRPLEEPNAAGAEAGRSQLSTTAAARPTAPERPAGQYRVSNALTIVIRDLDRVGQILSAATAAGANRVMGLSFEVSDTTALAEMARSEAVEKARHKAERLADLAGVSLGRVVAIREMGGPQPVPGPRMMNLEAAESAAPVPVQTGEVEVVIRVEMVYSLDE